MNLCRTVRSPMAAGALLLVLPALVAVLAPAHWAETRETTYFVSPSGDDAHPGSAARPWKTIGMAAATLQAGETLQVRAGRYRERIVLRNSGRPGAEITFSAFPGETVVFDGAGIDLQKDEGLFELPAVSYIRVSGFHLINSAHAGFLADNSHHLTLEKNRTEKTGSSGIGIWGCKEVLIDGNEVASSCLGPWQEAISVAGTQGFEVRDNHVYNGPPRYGKEGITLKDGSSKGKVYRNHVHHVFSVGIYLDAWDKRTGEIEVFGNRVHDVHQGSGFALASEMGGLLEKIRLVNNDSWKNGHCGFAITTNGDSQTHPMREIALVNNTAWANGRGEWGGGILVDDPDLVSAVIRNNLCSKNLTFEIAHGARQGRPGIVLDHNLCDGRHEDPDEYPGRAAVGGDPWFANPEGGDFRLGPGSPALDAGSADGAPAEDAEGAARPQGAGIDIGAHERS